VGASFEDPIPYRTGVTSIVIKLFGAFNCGGEESKDDESMLEAIAFFQDQHLSVKVPSAYGNCEQPYCTLESIDIPFSSAYYTSGGENVFKIIAGVPFCVSHLIAELQWTVKIPTVASTVPNCGPIEGGTTVLVRASELGVNLQYECFFASSKVSAATTELGGLTLTCTSPKKTNKGKVKFGLIDSRFPECYVDSPFSFFEYYDASLISLSPQSGTALGGVDLVITGKDFSVDSAVIICLFVSSSAQPEISVAGILLDGVIHCATPPWPVEEEAQVRVSFNGGVQYTDQALLFSFFTEPSPGPILFSEREWLYIVLGVAFFLFLTVLIAFWVRRAQCQDGPRRLREGNVQEITMGDLRLLECVGKGTFGEVYRAEWRGAIIAVKKLPLQNLKDGALSDFQKEIAMMQPFRHPNVLQYLGGCLTPPDIFIALEYMSRGSLYELLHHPTLQLTWAMALHFLTDASKGMIYLHSLTPPIIHRDLKSHNLLVDEAWRVKVSDFGLSTHLDQQGTMTACGTPSWTAPEVIRHSRYTEKADVYSFGVVMWESIVREDPYLGLPPFKVIYAVGHQGMRPSIPQYAPAPYKTIVRKCWSEDPVARPSFTDLLERLAQIERHGFSAVTDVFSSSRATIVPSLEDFIPATPKVKRTRNKQRKGKPKEEAKPIPVQEQAVQSSSPIAVSFIKDEAVTSSLNPEENTIAKAQRLHQQFFGTFIPPGILSTAAEARELADDKLPIKAKPQQNITANNNYLKKSSNYTNNNASNNSSTRSIHRGNDKDSNNLGHHTNSHEKHPNTSDDQLSFATAAFASAMAQQEQQRKQISTSTSPPGHLAESNTSERPENNAALLYADFISVFPRQDNSTEETINEESQQLLSEGFGDPFSSGLSPSAQFVLTKNAYDNFIDDQEIDNKFSINDESSGDSFY
jgi:serine/threonine protein kinase